MPSKTSDAPVDTSLCRRCQENGVAISVRSQPVCKDCFSKYVQTKIVKRLETFRVKNSEPGKERTLLLPLSFGPCSTALLRVLSRHLKGQIEKSGRIGFKLHILHVQLPDEPLRDDILEKSKQLYPEHTYASIPLSSITDHPSLLPSELQHIANTTQSSAPDSKLSTILSALPTATSRSDAIGILLRKLLIHQARTLDCGAVLFSDSTTRLSERVLAETAKGRGFSLPWVVSDGDSPFGVPVYYPLRELLSKEVAAFINFVEPSMESMVVKDDNKLPPAMKNTTIDDLTRQYFGSVEVDYPSIVANVVRTTNKLHARPLSEVEAQCELCDMPLEGQAPERSRLCYGCIRTMPQSTA